MTGCEYAHDDGAYVLGALAPAERAAYERHLAGCAPCRQALAEIAVLPGLLGRLDPADVAQLAPPSDLAQATSPSDVARFAPLSGKPQVAEPVGRDSRIATLLDAARAGRRRERRRTRWRYAAGVALAVAVALVVGFGAAWLRLPVRSGRTEAVVGMVTMQPVSAAVPVHARISLRAAGWGTEITMRCGYDDAGDYPKAYAFRLVAHGADGTTEQVASWLAAPGDNVRFTGATRFTGAELVRLELVRYDGSPLLAYDVP